MNRLQKNHRIEGEPGGRAPWLLCCLLLVTAPANAFDWFAREHGQAASSAPASQPILIGGQYRLIGGVKMMSGPPPDPLDAFAGYRLGPHDEISIEVFQIEELSQKKRVSAQGEVMLPLIGKVRLGGLTTEEAERLIAEKLAQDYLQDPQVSVYVEDYASQRVTVTGQVKSPGLYPIKGRVTLIQAIAMAGGVDRLAEDANVVIFRASGEDNHGYIVDLGRVYEGAVRDPLLVADDRIYVPQSAGLAFWDELKRFVRVPVLGF